MPQTLKEKQASAAKRFGRALDELRRVAQKQGWAVMPLTDVDGSSLGIYGVGKLDSLALLQELLAEASQKESDIT